MLTAPHFVSVHGPGGAIDPGLERAWAGFDLAGSLSAALGVPFRVGNDADVQGSAVVSGHGLELVLTLGTGLGSSVFRDGRLALHLELAHHPAKNGEVYNLYVGDAARAKLGGKRWNRRVRTSLVAFDIVILPDAILIGGGNAGRVDLPGLAAAYPDLAAKVRVVGNEGGLLGGIRLWDEPGPD